AHPAPTSPNATRPSTVPRTVSPTPTPTLRPTLSRRRPRTTGPIRNRPTNPIPASSPNPPIIRTSPSPSRPRAGTEGSPARAIPFAARTLILDGVGEGADGRRGRATGPRGRDVRAIRGGRGLHVPGTVLAAAERGAVVEGGVVKLEGGDVRGAQREGRESNLIVFLVDTSGSMAARDRLEAVTGAVQSLLRDAYQRRDRVAVVTFRGSDATIELPPTRSTDAANRRLRDLRTGGRTPLSLGLERARDLIEREHRRDPTRR